MHRKIIAPTFGRHVLRIYQDIAMEQASMFTDKLEEIGSGEVNLLHHLKKYNFNVILGKIK